MKYFELLCLVQQISEKNSTKRINKLEAALLEQKTNENARLIKLEADISELKSHLEQKTNENAQLILLMNNMKKIISPPPSSPLLLFDNCKNEVQKILNKNKHKKLLLYKNFDLTYLFNDIFYLCDHNENNNILRHIVDNCIDLNVKVNLIGFQSNRIIHLFSRSPNKEMIAYLFLKNADFNVKDNDGRLPLKLALTYSTYEIAEFFIKNKINFESFSKSKILSLIEKSGFKNLKSLI